MSLYPHVRFLTSAAEPGQLAADVGREVAFAGRSNAGKSTAINAILERSGLARVSRTPGRTQLINFFEVVPERRFVDLPGYGFAKVPEKVQARWLALMEHYFNTRESLAGLVLIVDSRRGLGAQDATMLEWVLARGRRAHVLLTKSDKLNRRDSTRVLKETQDACRDAAVSVQLFSAHAKQGLIEAREVLRGWLDASGQKKAPVDA
jgi:GTP-binding protein